MKFQKITPHPRVKLFDERNYFFTSGKMAYMQHFLTHFPFSDPLHSTHTKAVVFILELTFP